MRVIPLLLVLMCCALPAYAGEAEQIFERMHRSVVTITTFDERNRIDGEGSGVVIGPGHVVTNCHVVNEANAIQVNSDEKKLSATLLSGDLKSDLCLLYVAELQAPAVSIRPSEDLIKGEAVYAIGNPLGFGLSVSSGLISNIKRSKSETQIFTNAPISPGSSGGGLFDAQCRLVGITTRLYFGAQNFNMALPAELIAGLQQNSIPEKKTKPADPNWYDTAESLRSSGDWIKLEEWSRRWEKAWPTSSMADYYLGVALFKKHINREAEEAIHWALKKNPRNTAATSYLSLIHREAGDKKAAYDDLQRALKLQPSLGYGYSILAEWQKADGNVDDALTSIETALRLTPWDWNCWEILGELRQGKRQYHEAKEAYRTALRLKPSDPKASSNLASILAYLGESDAARKTLSGNSGAQSNNAQAWFNIGVAEEKKQHYMEAESAYRKALELNTSMAGAWSGLGGIFIRTNRVKDAEDAFLQAVKLNPGFGSAWCNLGHVLREQGLKEEAIQAYEKSTLADPVIYDAWYFLGILQRELKNFPQAVSALDRATKLNPLKCESWAILGEMQIRLGHDEDGFKSLHEAEKIDSKNEHTLQGLSMYFGKRGDYERAIRYVDRALEVNPASSHAWSNKGYTLLKMKRYAEAAKALEIATRLQPDFANAWINLGETYLRQGLAGKAIVTLEKGLQLSPTATDARLFIVQAYTGVGQYDMAQSYIEKLLLQAPQLPDAWLMQTIIFVRQNKKLDAMSSYGKLKSLNSSMAKELRERFMRGEPRYDLPE